MLEIPRISRHRIGQLGDRIRDLIYATTVPADEILVGPRCDRIPFAEAMRLKYRPARRGAPLGPKWSTFWFKARATVPKAWRGQRVDLLWNSHSEATLWVDGNIRQGLNHEPDVLGGARHDAVLVRRSRGGEKLAFAVEVACNKMFGQWGTYESHPVSLRRCDLALFDAEASRLYFDFRVLFEVMEQEQEHPTNRAWGGELLMELNRFANICDPADRATWPAARQILEALYRRHNGGQTHQISAIGHAHIDTAWLWPIAETWRKCERTFSSQLAYMEEYPEYRFACSQAVQFWMMKQRNPHLYRRIAAKAKTGRFVPVGGTWVEPDCNIPSGESMARQFLYGQRFFQAEFGKRCTEFWNPDVFGYNGQLPQLMRLSGITRFLTQKLSWNQVNKPAHHTFLWQGIDGSEVLTHFPPVDTYNGMCTPEELRRAVGNYKDNDRSRHSLLPFGFGDGGGGPTKRMIEFLRRSRDLQGVPKVEIRTPEKFFDLLEKDLVDAPVVVGELYFECHRGTYTTQAKTKLGNRRGERLLHDVEFLAVAAAASAHATYPKAELDRLWRTLLTNQFHDILPGSSINLVYQDTERDHAELQRDGEALATKALARLGKGKPAAPVNTIGHARAEVADGPQGRPVWVTAPNYGIGRVADAPDRVTATRRADGGVTLENAHLKAELSAVGSLTSLVEKSTGREALSAPGNVLEIADDHPHSSDAWDVDAFHLETIKPCPAADSCVLTARGPLRAEVTFKRKVGERSPLTQVARLDAGARRLEFRTTVDWHEEHKFLKVAFPVAVLARQATYEMPFGCVERPTHQSNSYAVAQFEVPGHTWSDSSEPGFGVALLNDCKYGFSTRGNVMRLSLLRATKNPDELADMGRQVFAYAVMPHAGDWRQAGVVAEAHRFNSPLRWCGAAAPRSLVGVDDPNLVLDTVKRAEDSDALVLRLYECHGARGTARIRCALPFKRARACNLLEDPGTVLPVEGDTVTVAYAPFQIISVILTE
jgi:alpha-mannosidase